MTKLQAMVLVASTFLLRVQSEALELQPGVQGDEVHLPESRHSGVWVEIKHDNSEVLHLRLARRKKKPQGSHMVRHCVCGVAGSVCCVVHAMATAVEGQNVGDALFEFSSASLLKQVR